MTDDCKRSGLCLQAPTFKAYDLLIATNRDVRGGGRAYQLLSEALDRLQGTQIATNIATGDVGGAGRVLPD